MFAESATGTEAQWILLELAGNPWIAGAIIVGLTYDAIEGKRYHRNRPIDGVIWITLLQNGILDPFIKGFKYPAQM